jgi:hypothetical protein
LLRSRAFVFGKGNVGAKPALMIISDQAPERQVPVGPLSALVGVWIRSKEPFWTKKGEKKKSVLECRSKWKKVLIGVAVVALGYGAQAEDGKVDVKDEVCYPQSPIAYCGQ